MNAMGYGQPYPVAPGAMINQQIVRRFLTDAERELPARIYRNLQKSLRGLAAFCLILFVFDTYVLSAIISDPITYDSISMTMYVFMAVFGLVAIGMSVNTIVVRRRIEDAMRDGTAVEVTGPAYRTGGMGKAMSWTVGPISMMPTRDLQGVIQEGMQTTVLCLPRLKSAIAINNYGLKQGARIMFPPNLEAMAVPVGLGAMPMAGQSPGPAYPSYGVPIPQPQAPQTVSDEELPPPPPPD